jgi:hypothetical protein
MLDTSSINWATLMGDAQHGGPPVAGLHGVQVNEARLAGLATQRHLATDPIIGPSQRLGVQDEDPRMRVQVEQL